MPASRRAASLEPRRACRPFRHHRCDVVQTGASMREDDGLAPSFAGNDHPRILDGGAAERLTETNGHRVLALVEG